MYFCGIKSFKQTKIDAKTVNDKKDLYKINIYLEDGELSVCFSDKDKSLIENKIDDGFVKYVKSDTNHSKTDLVGQYACQSNNCVYYSGNVFYDDNDIIVYYYKTKRTYRTKIANSSIGKKDKNF